MRISLRFLLCGAALLAFFYPGNTDLAAQSGPRERTLFVSAVDQKGEPVEGLGPDAFAVREGGRRREILRVSPATEPMDVAIFVDNSQAAQAAIPFFRDALPAFVTALTGDVRVALIGLAERPTVIVPYTTDKAQVNAAIGKIFSIAGSGMTLLDALFETSRGVRSRKTPRAAFVPVFTDNVEFTNRYSKDIVRELTRDGVSLHVVGIGRFAYQDDHPIRERAFLIDEGPKATGGARITLLTPQPLTMTLERLARELSHQYKVVFARPDAPFDGTEVEISSPRRDLTVRGIPARGEDGGKK